MSRAKSVLGIAVLFALALSAFAASSASAKGLTAYTCVTDPSGTFFGDHCLSTGTGNKAKHVEIKQDETTTGTATNANTAEGTTAAESAILHVVLAGVSTEITCKAVHGEGTFENRKNATSGEMFAHAEGKLHYTECVVKAPAGKGCKVSGETITTEQLTGTTEGVQEVGKTHTAKITPKSGTKFTDIKIEGCSVEGLNNTFPVTGSLKATIDGATLKSTGAEITEQNTLKMGGQKAGLQGALTLKAHKKPVKEGEEPEETKPLTVTTEP